VAVCMTEKRTQALGKCFTPPPQTIHAVVACALGSGYPIHHLTFRPEQTTLVRAAVCTVNEREHALGLCQLVRLKPIRPISLIF